MVRKITKNDIDKVMEIWLEENIKAHNFIDKNYWINNYEYVKEALLHSDVYLYELDKQILGFIGLNDNYIEGLFVDYNYKLNGVGRILVNKCKSQRNTLTLNVYEKNTDAIEFYKKQGFEITNKKINEDTKEYELEMTWKRN